MFGASKQIVVVVAIHAQIMSKNMLPTISKALKIMRGRQNNCRDFNSYVQWLLLFDFRDISFATKAFILTST